MKALERSQAVGRPATGQVKQARAVPAPATQPLARQPAARPQVAVSGAVQADLGKQLSRRVAAGAIEQPQAQKVAQDRAILERAYGPNWRVKVFGDKGYVQRTRQGLKADPNDPAKKALYDQLMKRRSTMLARAKA